MISRRELVDLILEGKKTEIRCKVKPGEPCRYEVGKTYAVQPGRGKPAVARIRVLSVRKEELWQLTLADAQREGFGGLFPVRDFYRYWKSLYGEVDALQEVWAIRFEVVS